MEPYTTTLHSSPALLKTSHLDNHNQTIILSFLEIVIADQNNRNAPYVYVVKIYFDYRLCSLGNGHHCPSPVCSFVK